MLPVSAFHCHRLCCPSPDLEGQCQDFQPTLLEARIVVGQHSSTVSLLKETTNLLKTPKEPTLCLLSTQAHSFGMICSRVLGRLRLSLGAMSDLQSTNYCCKHKTR